MKRVLAVASEGGHWIQLMRIRPAFDGIEVIYVSTNKDLKSAFGLTSFYVLPDANLDNKIRLLYLFIKAFFLVVRVRPTHVITTGAAPGFAVMFWGRIFRAKTIWIDSIANADELSAAGKKAEFIATHWLTQWPHLTHKYPSLECKGRVI